MWDVLYKFVVKVVENGEEKVGKLFICFFGLYVIVFLEVLVLIVCLVILYELKFCEKIFDLIVFVLNLVWEEEGIKSSCLVV